MITSRYPVDEGREERLSSRSSPYSSNQLHPPAKVYSQVKLLFHRQTIALPGSPVPLKMI